MSYKSALFRHAVLVAAAFFLSACAVFCEPSGRRRETVYDPWETFNRQSFDTNYFLDRLLWRPLGELYRVTVPPGIRDRVAGVVGNMKEPVILANNLLQGEFEKAGITVERFGINTTIGVGGMWNVAGEWGLYQQTGNFGQTLAVWGVGGGPYLVLPLVGPSNFRDTLGLGVDIALSPWQYLTLMESTSAFFRFEAASIGTDILIKREKNIENIDNWRAGSLDFYAMMRSIYQQQQEKQSGEQPMEIPEFENDE